MLQWKWNVTRWMPAFALALTLAAPSNAAPVEARRGDVASHYELVGHTLKRRVGNRWCDVTTNVLHFKVSHHPTDVAMAYYIKDESTPNLFALNNSERTGNCPRTESTRIASHVIRVNGAWKYSVVSNTHTTIVNTVIARTGHSFRLNRDYGEFIAWDRRVPVLRQPNVVNYVMNPNYHVANRPFARYVAFLINTSGHVLKVDGQNPGQSNWDESAIFDSLDDFKRHHRLN